MDNKKIKRVEYIRRGGVLKPHKKVVFEKLESDCYRVSAYSWIDTEKVWYPKSTSCFYDGEKLNDVGQICLTHNDIDRFFELMVKYSGFKYMEQDEVNISTEDELNRLKELEQLMLK